MDQELIDADTTVGDIRPARSVPLGYVEVATSVTAHSRHTLHSSPPGNGDSSVVQWYSAGLVIETSRVRVQAGALGNFLLRSQVSVLTLISVSVPPPYDRSCT